MTKFSKAVAEKKQTVGATTAPEAEATAPTAEPEAPTGATDTVETPVTATKEPTVNPVPEVSENELRMQKQIDDLTKMVRTVSDRNAIEKFDDDQKGQGNTMYSLPLYEGKVVRSWNYVNPLQVKLMKGEADDSVMMEMYDGTKFELTYRMWVKTMYATEQVHSLSTTVKDGNTIVSFSYKAIGDDSYKVYEIDKRFLNAR